MRNSGKLLMIVLIFFVLVLSDNLLLGEQNKQEKNTKEIRKKEKKKKEKSEGYVWQYEVTVTATGLEKETFKIPKPVSVITDHEIIEKAPNNVSELMNELPGLDIVGVGANQSRPVIRGLRGQRILLLENGIRMNNSRRQQDFGEIPSLIDISEVKQMEVVRGPASVLYGSDAIGGVVNIITKTPDYDIIGSELHGNLGYRYSSADNQHKGIFNLNGHYRRFGFMISGNYRQADDYLAPAGTFGEIELLNDTPVNDTGVDDYGFNIFLNYQFSLGSNLSFKFEYYNAQNAGFGYVPPELYDPGSPTIRILYPFQKVNKYSLMYRNTSVNFALIDHIDFTCYYLDNRRELEMDVFVPFNMPVFPDAGLSSYSKNYTDVDTFGLRLEFRKVIFKDHVLTYGVDFYNDDSFNTDINQTQMIGLGPSVPSVDNSPDLPNASYSSVGFFIQDDIPITKKSNMIVGLRYQNVNARTKETTGLEDYEHVNSNDQTIVGAVNFIHSLSDNLNVFLSIGRGFRSPNLIERFYNGLTPAGGAFQSRNPDLEAETSLNFDVGFKYRQKNLLIESSYFHNTIYDGIRIERTGNIILGFPEYQNVNIDKLRVQGIEFLARYYFNFGLNIMANYTSIKAKDLGNPELPYSNTYSSKFNLNIHYGKPDGFIWSEYSLRIHGNQKDVDLGINPIGSIIPGFTVHYLSAGVNLLRHSNYPMRVGVVIVNLTDTLYSEFANASFFRPAPRRQIILTWSVSF